jgi:glycosyltransferase involved in cell wall biosynthesis
MRVTHVNINSHPSQVDGVRSAVANLARAQTERGDEVEVVDASWLECHGGRLSAEHPVLARTDIVHLHSVFRPRHMQIARWCRGTGVPYVVSPHSGLTAGSLARQRGRKALWIAAFDARMLSTARAVVCLTPAERSEVRRVSPDARTAIVPNLSPPPSAGQRWMYRPDDPHVVTLARFDVWQKGLDRLTEIARRLPDVRFTVYGGFDKNDPRRARRLINGAPPNLAFAAPVHGSHKAKVLAEASLYLQPSRWEGMSVALLEAFAQATPCAVSPYIAASLGRSASQIAATVADDPELATATIRNLLGDPDRLRAMSVAGLDWMQATTDPDAVVAALATAYRGGPPGSNTNRFRTRRQGGDVS